MPTPRVITHLLDPKRGRASQTKHWTLCGEAVMTRLVYSADQVKQWPQYSPATSCKACILAEALEYSRDHLCWMKLHAGLKPTSSENATVVIRKCDATLARVRGEQIQDAPK